MPWHDATPFLSILVENSQPLARAERRAGEWRYLLEQSAAPRRAATSRATFPGYPDKRSAQIAAEDHLDRIRNPAPPCADPAMHVFDVIRHRGIWL